MEGGVPSSSIINDLNAVEKILPRLRKTSSPPLLSPASPSRGVDPTPGRQGEPLHTASGCTGRASLVGKDNQDNHDVTHLEPDILECEVKWALGSITTNKVSGGDRIPVEVFQT